MLRRLLGPRRAQCWATPSGHDQTRPKMLLLTVFYKIECSLHEKETFLKSYLHAKLQVMKMMYFFFIFFVS